MQIVDDNSVTLPSNQADRDAIKNAIEEMTGAMTRMDGERTLINETAAMLKDKYNLPPAVMKRVARMRHKDNIDREEQNFNNLETVYRSLF